MTIVCATYFSDSSLAAVKVAAQLARTHREPVWLVEVVSPMGNGDVTLSQALIREAASLVEEGLTVNTAAIPGPFDRAVRQFCSVQRAGLLVVGDSQQTLGPLIVGPLDRFADRMSVPVLIVRDAKPFEAWASGAGPLRVMLALDSTWKSAAARDWIARLSTYGAIDLVASFLFWPKDEGRSRRHQPWVEAEAAFGHLPSNVKRRVRLEPARQFLGPQLLRMAAADKVDVVVLGTHHHRGRVGEQWSVSHEMLALAPMSVACIPEPVSLSQRADLRRAGHAEELEQTG